MEERPLIAFTLLAQGAVGTGLVLLLITSWQAAQGNLATAQALEGMGWPMIAVMVSLGLLGFLCAPGRPGERLAGGQQLEDLLVEPGNPRHRGFRGPVHGGRHRFRLDASPHTLALTVQRLALGAGLIAIYCMAMAYRLPAVPAWDSVLTPLSFFATAFLLGGIACGSLLGFGEWTAVAQIQAVWHLPRCQHRRAVDDQSRPDRAVGDAGSRTS